MAIVYAFLVNDIAFALDSRNLSSGSALAPTSIFNPIVTLKWDEEHSQYLITENQEEKDRFVYDYQEDAAFVYLNLLIGQFQHDLSGLSKLGVSDRGLKEHLEEIKKDRLAKFIESIRRDLPHINFDRFRFNEMYWDGNTVCLPYERIPLKLAGLGSSGIPRHLDIRQMEEDKKHLQDIFDHGDSVLSETEKEIFLHPESIDWNKIPVGVAMAVVNAYYRGAQVKQRGRNFTLPKQADSYSAEDYQRDHHGSLMHILEYAALTKAGTDLKSPETQELLSYWPTISTSFIKGVGQVDIWDYDKMELVFSQLIAFIKTSPAQMKIFLKLMHSILECAIDDYRYRAYFNTHLGGMGDQHEYFMIEYLLDAIHDGDLNIPDGYASPKEFNQLMGKANFSYYGLYSVLPGRLRYFGKDMNPQEEASHIFGNMPRGESIFWSIHEVYQTLTADKTQGLNIADDIWSEFRKIVVKSAPLQVLRYSLPKERQEETPFKFMPSIAKLHQVEIPTGIGNDKVILEDPMKEGGGAEKESSVSREQSAELLKYNILEGRAAAEGETRIPLGNVSKPPESAVQIKATQPVDEKPAHAPSAAVATAQPAVTVVAADPDRERNIAIDFRDVIITRASEAKKEGQTIIFGLDESWILNMSCAQPIIQELERLPENLRQRGLDNVIFVRGKGDDVAVTIQGKQKETNAHFSNIVILGSQAILKSAEFNKLKGETAEDAALLIGVNTTNLSDISDMGGILEMYLLAMRLNAGKAPSELDQSFINILPDPDGRPRIFIFTPIKPYNIEDRRTMNKIQIEQIDTKA